MAAEAAPAAKRLTVPRALLLVTVLLAAAAAVRLVVTHVSQSSGEGRLQGAPLVSPAGLVARSGVRVVRVAVSGDGGLIDLRYQVVDSDKAAAVHDQATPPLLIDERTGAVVNELLMGHIHSGSPKLGLTYYLIFVNSGTIIKRGGRVTVQLGDALLAHVPVL